MSRLFLTPIDLNKNEIRNVRIQNLASNPTSPVSGQLYFNTSSDALLFYDGGGWVALQSAEGTITSVSGIDPIVTNTDGNTAEISINPATTEASGSMSAPDKAKLDGVESGATANMEDSLLLARANHTGTQGIETISGLQDGLDSKEDKANKGAASGYASLDSQAKVPANQLPSIAITETHVVANLTERDALTAGQGDVAVVDDATPDTDGEPASYIHDGSATDPWKKLRTPFTGVSNVAGAAPITSTGGDTPEIGLADGGISTTHIGNEQVTENKLSSDVQMKINAPQGALKHAETIGDGTATEFTITHNLDTRDVSVSVYQAGTPYAQVETGVELTTVNSVTIRFAIPPAANEYRVVVVG